MNGQDLINLLSRAPEAEVRVESMIVNDPPRLLAISDINLNNEANSWIVAIPPVGQPPMENKPKIPVNVMMTNVNNLRMSCVDDIADAVHQNAVEHGFHDPNQAEGDFLAHMCCNK